MPSRKTRQNANLDECILYTAGFDKVVTLPARAVLQMPAQCQAKRLVICNFFEARKPDTSCPLNDKCKFVHADLRQAISIQTVHINYAWQRASDVSYERFSGGLTLEVAPPGRKHVVDTMDSSLALKTKALGSTRLPLQHCAHYYYTRQCDLGSDCMFVHAVFIDPEAAPLQRAPLPRDMGRGREHLAPPPVAVAVVAEAEAAVAAKFVDGTAAMNSPAPPPCFVSSTTLSASDNDLHHTTTLPMSESDLLGALLNLSSPSSSCSCSSATDSTPTSARPHSGPDGGVRYRRHDPYLFVTPSTSGGVGP